MFVSLFVACLAVAEADFDSQLLLTPRDSKPLSALEARSWIRSTCNVGSTAFAWRGCKLDQIDGRDYLVLKDTSFFAAVSVVTGSFTAPNQREALVMYLEQETECCRTVDVLLRYQRGQFRPVMLVKGSIGAGCLLFRLLSRRDALGCAGKAVCRSSSRCSTHLKPATSSCCATCGRAWH